MKKLIRFSAFLIVCILVVTLVEANYKMLLDIAPNPAPWLSMVKSVGFALAAITVIISHPRQWVKMLFVSVDMGIMFLFQYYTPDTWKHSAALIYALYTGLILAFIGNMVSDMLKADQQQKSTDTSEKRKLRAFEIKEQIKQLQRTGRGPRWDKIPERVESVKKLNNELELIND